MLHQLNHHINSLEEKYKLEKYKRRNIFSILDTLSEGVILVSSKGPDIARIDFANNVARYLFNSEDYVGRSLTAVIDNHNLVDLVIQSFKENEDLEEDILFYYPEKKIFNCKVKSINVENYRVIILADITKEINLENLRKEFLTIMSHEMRTPLSVINGYLEILLNEKGLDPKIHSYLRK